MVITLSTFLNLLFLFILIIRIIFIRNFNRKGYDFIYHLLMISFVIYFFIMATSILMMILWGFNIVLYIYNIFNILSSE